MLSKVRIQNFKSIDDLTVDFSYMEGKAPGGFRTSEKIYFLEPTKNKKDRKVPVMSIYGANASGKSNLIEAMSIISRLLLSGFKSNFYKPNRLAKKIKSDIEIDIEFFIDNKKANYKIAYNQFSITKENLNIDGQEIYKISNSSIIISKSLETKLYKHKDFEDIFKTACIYFKNNEKFQINPFLKSLLEKLPGLNKDIFECSFALTLGMLVFPTNKISPEFSFNALSIINPKLKMNNIANKVLMLMQKLNININKMQCTPKKSSEEDIEDFKINIDFKTNNHFKEEKLITRMDIISYCENMNKELVPFDFMKEESTGTVLLFSLLAIILTTLHTGGTLIIDEIDKSLHPLILLPLIKMFKSKKYNKNNAQLFFTLHTTEVLEDKDFRVSEFLFLNKSVKKGTFATKLTDIEDSNCKRNDINFRKRYLKGFYLGIPYTMVE